VVHVPAKSACIHANRASTKPHAFPASKVIYIKLNVFLNVQAGIMQVILFISVQLAALPLQIVWNAHQQNVLNVRLTISYMAILVYPVVQFIITSRISNVANVLLHVWNVLPI